MYLYTLKYENGIHEEVKTNGPDLENITVDQVNYYLFLRYKENLRCSRILELKDNLNREYELNRTLFKVFNTEVISKLKVDGRSKLARKPDWFKVDKVIENSYYTKDFKDGNNDTSKGN